MKTKLMILCLLVSCGLRGAQVLDQAKLVMQEEINLNRANLINSLEKLGEKKLVLNGYQTKWQKIGLQHKLSGIKSVEDQLCADNQYSIEKSKSSENTFYLLMQDVDQWLGAVETNASGTFICNILFSSDPNESNEQKKCCEVIKEICNLPGRKVVVNAEEGCQVEEYLASLLQNKDSEIMEKSKITFRGIEWNEKAEQDLKSRLQLYMQKQLHTQKNYSFLSKILIFGGVSISALIAFLCYLQWNR